MVASDRVSAFDVIMAEPIPDKGRVLTAMTSFWCDEMADVVPGHAAGGRPGGRSRRRLGAACSPADGPGGPSSCAGRDAPARVHRAWLSGRTGLGGVREARARCTAPPCPTGLQLASRLARADVHARRPRPPRATTSTSTSRRPSTWSAGSRPRRPRSVCLELYSPRRPPGRRRAGFILADTKFELGLRRRGTLPVRRGVHARLLAPLAGRPGRARHDPARLRQAAVARLAGRPALGPHAAARRPCHPRWSTPCRRATSPPTSASPDGRWPTGTVRRHEVPSSRRGAAARPGSPIPRGPPSSGRSRPWASTASPTCGRAAPSASRWTRRTRPRRRTTATDLADRLARQSRSSNRAGSSSRRSELAPRIGVVVFPGTNCEHDVVQAAEAARAPRACCSGTATPTLLERRRRGPARAVSPTATTCAPAPWPASRRSWTP